MPVTQEFARNFMPRKEAPDVDNDMRQQTELPTTQQKSNRKRSKYNGHNFSTFENHPGYQLLQKRKAEAIERNISIPFFLTNTSANNNIVTINNKEYVNFSGYNYLGLSGHPAVSSAAKQAIATRRKTAKR